MHRSILLDYGQAMARIKTHSYNPPVRKEIKRATYTPKPMQEPGPIREPGFLQMDEKLKLTEKWVKMHQTVVDETPVPMAVLTETGTVAFWNEKAESVYGYKTDTVIGNFLPGISEESKQDILFLLVNGFQGFRVEGKSTTLRRQGGATVKVMITVTPLYDERDKVFALLCMIEDVSRTRFLEDKLREYRQRSQIAKEMANVESWNIPLVAPFNQAPPLGGWTIAEVIEQIPFLQQFLQMFVRQNRRQIASGLLECLESGEPFDIKATVLNGKNERVTVRVSGQMIESEPGSRSAIEVGVQDITRQTQTEEQLLLQLSALEAVENMLVITNAQGQIEWANPSFCRITGYDPDENEGGGLWELCHEEAHPPGEFDAMWMALLSGAVWKGEVNTQSANAEPLQEMVTISPICREGDTITHFVAVKEEITEKKKIEQQIFRAERMDSLGSLAGGIAHDLNNVLAPIVMGLDLLLLDTKDPEQEEMIENLKRSAQRGGEMVKQILTFARGGKETQERLPVDLTTTIRELRRMVQRTFPKNIHSVFDFPSDLWTVVADPTQIYQVMLNLCMNARDAMPKGGELRVRLENVLMEESRRSGQLELRAGPHVLLEVRDSGIGIPPELWDKLFDPFFTTKPIGEGTGLGLATLQQIVTKHGGRVEFTSKAGEGTAFKVYLPADAKGKQAHANGDGAEQLPSGNGEFILLVDDEDPVRLLTKQILNRFGYEVNSCASGETAVQALERDTSAFDLMIVDMDMPGMTGPKVIRLVRGLRPDIPILGCSGHAKPEVIDDARQAGMNAFLNKPYSAKQLLQHISRLLSLAKASR